MNPPPNNQNALPGEPKEGSSGERLHNTEPLNSAQAESQAHGVQAPPPLDDIEITLYKNAFDTVGENRSLAAVANTMRSDPHLAASVAQLRPLYWKADDLRFLSNQNHDLKAAYDRCNDKYDTEKKQLPAFTISGTFKERKIAGLTKYSGMLLADLDHLRAKGIDIGELKQRLAIDPYVYFYFVSPSGDGLKVAFNVASGDENHPQSFLGMQRYVEATYGIRPDDTCKDVSRLCFLSSNPDLWINPQPAIFNWREWLEPAIEDVEEEEDTPVPMPLDALPLVMQDLAKSCAEVFLVDPALPAVSAVTVMAAALGKAVECEGAVNGRKTPCGLYTAVSAPSGYGKSVVGRVAKPFTDVSAEMAKRFEEKDSPQLIAGIAIAEAKKKDLLKNLKGTKGGGVGEDEARRRLQELEAEIQRWRFEATEIPSLHAGSATGPALGRALKRNGEQLLQLAYEAGDCIRISAGRFTSDSKGDYDLYLSGYTGEPYKENRLSRELRLAAPCLSVLWCVQPCLLRELYGTAEAQERGLLARINVVTCDDDVAPFDDGVVREVPPAVEQKWAELVRAAIGLRKTGRKVVFRAEADAREVFRRFHNESVGLRNGDGRENEAKLMRCRENAIRIALVIAATKWLAAGAVGDTPALTANHAARGVAIAEYFLANTLKLTRAAVLEVQRARLSQVLGLIDEAGGSIPLRRLRDHHGFGEAEVNLIVERNPDKLKIETAVPGRKGGRPSPCLVMIRGGQS